MRRWFVLLMMVLLPLRGWAGDVMSIEMATAAGPHHAAAAMPADCAMHMDAATEAPADQAPGMESCASCQLCIPLAEIAGAPLVVLGFASHEKPVRHGEAFVSALPALAQKPPIS